MGGETKATNKLVDYLDDRNIHGAKQHTTESAPHENTTASRNEVIRSGYQCKVNVCFVTVNVRYISANIGPFRERFDRPELSSVRNRGLKKCSLSARSRTQDEFDA